MAQTPSRIMLIEFMIEEGKGPTGIIHQLVFADDTSFEVYTPWKEGIIDTEGSRVLERSQDGKIQRLAPPEEIEVAPEWRALIRKFETKRQKVTTLMRPRWP